MDYRRHYRIVFVIGNLYGQTVLLLFLPQRCIFRPFKRYAFGQYFTRGKQMCSLPFVRQGLSDEYNGGTVRLCAAPELH